MTDGAAAAPGSSSTPEPDGAGAMLDRAGEIFLSVRELRPAVRDEAIERLCSGQVELRKLVQLLVRGDQAPLPVEGLADDIRAARDARTTTRDGTIESRAAAHGGDRIGNYRILERLGEGGFGVVYMADQERPVRRRVALKIIKLGMDTRQVVARFEAERQALALMDHPSIAKVFDAGSTETGRPYFAMELVRGSPITEYCDRKKLSIRRRLELIAQVCDALQHAHQKGVIHRDIKSSNVLVEGIDSSGENGAGARGDSSGPDASSPAALHPTRVKIIDFGIAKATSVRLTEKTIFTEFRQMIGTPEYMSPEQAGESSEDVDTRTDVYSAGVLLYELLTGATPFDSTRLRSAAFGEMQRIIREEEPPKPSTKLTRCPEALDTIASARATHPVKLAKVVRGVLDWIVMKAIEKDRSRRYDSTGAMAADIQRYLTGHAVQAAPPSQAYRAGKFFRRHKGPALAGTLLACALVAGLIGTIAGFVNASAAQKETGKRADELRKVAKFQAEMLAQIDPTEAGRLLTADVMARFEAALVKAGVPEAGGERAAKLEAFATDWGTVNTTDAARELIDCAVLKPAVEAIDRQFRNEPLLDSRLREEVAHAYRTLGTYDAALRLQEQVVATRRREMGEEHKETLSAVINMAGLLHRLGKLDRAEALVRDTMEKMGRILGPEHPSTLTAIHTLGMLLLERDEPTEAEVYLREALEKMRRVLGEEDENTLNATLNMAGALRAQGRLDEAEAHVRGVMETIRRVRGDKHQLMLMALHNLGALLQDQGKMNDAERCYREALDKKRRVLGEGHPDTLREMTSLALLLQTHNRHAEAAELLGSAEGAARQALSGSRPPELAALLMILGVARMAPGVEGGEFAAAESNLFEAHTIFARTLGETHRSTRDCARALVHLYTTWHAAEPIKTYDTKAAEWKSRADAIP